MDDQLNQAADDLLKLTPDEVDRLERRVACLQCAVEALRVLAGRSYFTDEQAGLIRAEAEQLSEDTERLRATLYEVPLSTILQATIEELDRAGHEP